MFTAPPLEIDIRVGNQHLKEDVTELLRIDPDDILTELLEHSASFAYLATLKVMADKEHKDMKADLTRIRAEIYAELQDRKERGEKLTVASMEAIIEMSPVYIESLEKVNAVERKVNELGAVCNAFEHRRSMITAAANIIRASETPASMPERAKEAVRSAKSRTD